MPNGASMLVGPTMAAAEQERQTRSSGCMRPLNEAENPETDELSSMETASDASGSEVAEMRPGGSPGSSSSATKTGNNNNNKGKQAVTSQSQDHGRVYNFSAGPACLEFDIMQRAHAEFLNYEGTGMSVMELSHRDPDGPIHRMMTRATENLKNLLSIPDNYEVIFMHGGAHGQFSAVPLNLLEGRTNAEFVNTGFWAQRAMSEAQNFCKTNVCVDCEPLKYTTVPDPSQWKINPEAGYVHVCANETISGLEFLEDPTLPEGVDVPLVGDFTSTLLSRPVDVSKYGVIFASSGKNLGPAGVCVVIVRKDLLARKAHPQTPSILNWRKVADTEPIPSIYNTPSTFNIYMLGLILDDLVQKGGLTAVAKRCAERASKVYELIDNSDGFYFNRVDPKYRSRMNIAFFINNGNDQPDPELQRVFVKEGEENGLYQLFGHKSAGGLRVTLYNGIPTEAVDSLVSFMVAFKQKYSTRD